MSFVFFKLSHFLSDIQLFHYVLNLSIYIALIYFPPWAIIYFRELHTSLSGFEHFALQL
jgi:hypothetical protein